MPVTERVLSNNVRLITEPVAATYAAAIGFWFLSGSRDESAENKGVAHFIEHMIFKGTKTVSAKDISLFFDRTGGYINAFTERECVCVYFVVPAKFTDEAIEFVISLLMEPLFNEVDIEHERSVIESELIASLDDSEETGFDFALNSFYKGNEYSLPIGGTVHDIQKISKQQIAQWYRSQLLPQCTLITAAGDINEESLAERLQSFDTGLINEIAIKNSELVWKPGVTYIPSKFSLSQMYLSFPVIGMHSESDWYAWEIINDILANTVSSRFFQELREKKGLCYSVCSNVIHTRECAFWTSYVAAAPEKTFETLSAVEEVFEHFKRHGPTIDEFEFAKSRITGRLFLSAEDTENRMNRLARQYIYCKQVYDIEQLVDMVAHIEYEPFTNMLEQSFKADDRSLVLFAPKKQLMECKRRWK